MENFPTVLILAGGRSERFWPLSEKNLFPFLGETLLEIQLKGLKKLGFKNLIVAGNNNIIAWLREHKYDLPKVKWVQQSEQAKGMAGAVLSAKKLIAESDNQPLYILNCNDIYDPVLHRRMLKAYFKNKQDNFLAGQYTQTYQPLGYFSEDKGIIKGIIEKPGPEKMPSHWANLVAHLLAEPAEFIKYLEAEQKSNPAEDDVYERALNKLSHKKTFHLVAYREVWKILKYPWHVLDVMEYYLSGVKQKISRNVRIAENVSIEGAVVIESGVRIFSGSKIVGPCFIGVNTIIGNNCLIRDSMINQDCVIGFATDIARSYIGDECWLHTNYIGDSVLGRNVSFGSGSVTANLRLDENNIISLVNRQKIDSQRNKLGTIVGEGSRIGINASIMPGVKIGKNCVVGPGVVLFSDLADNKRCCLKQDLEIKPNRMPVIPNTRESFKKIIK